MKRPPTTYTIVIDRKATLALLAVVVVLGGAGLLFSQQLTMSATYPIPAGVYNQIVTTGDAGLVAADTTLNRNLGNTILIPPTNAGGRVGIGTATPASKFSVAGGIQFGDDVAPCAAAKVGTARWHAGLLEMCTGAGWQGPNATPLPAGTLAGGCNSGGHATPPALSCTHPPHMSAITCEPGWTPAAYCATLLPGGLGTAWGCCAKQ
ncbi:MAG: hypothetical protein ABL955_06605 [Elusimicrobiota bacterium]